MACYHEEHATCAAALAISPDGCMIAVASRLGVQLWEADTGHCLTGSVDVAAVLSLSASLSPLLSPVLVLVAVMDPKALKTKISHTHSLILSLSLPKELKTKISHTHSRFSLFAMVCVAHSLASDSLCSLFGSWVALSKFSHSTR